MIRAQGCDEVQGYLFSPPVTASGASDLIARLARKSPGDGKAVATLGGKRRAGAK